LFAEVSQADGALLRFDYYEDCNEETFDLQNAETIAEQFLEKLGYDDMEVVRFRNNGTTTDFTFLYEDDDIVYYPDEIHVKVCRTRGVVTGMDATKYILRHKEDRSNPQVKLNLAQAQAKLYDGLTVESSRLAVVSTHRGERAAYEFLCSYGEENYFVFLDAVSGEEIAIVNARGIE
jgi:spore germination protein